MAFRDSGKHRHGTLWTLLSSLSFFVPRAIGKFLLVELHTLYVWAHDLIGFPQFISLLIQSLDSILGTVLVWYLSPHLESFPRFRAENDLWQLCAAFLLLSISLQSPFFEVCWFRPFFSLYFLFLVTVHFFQCAPVAKAIVHGNLRSQKAAKIGGYRSDILKLIEWSSPNPGTPMLG